MRSFVHVVVATAASASTVCHLPVDVFFIQDTTGSFVGDLPKVKQQLPNLMEQVRLTNPHSRFGVGDHRDKPFHSLGELNDWCYRHVQALTDNPAEVTAAYATLWASGGKDIPESQFNAIIEAIHDPRTDWRDIRQDGKDMSRTGARLIVLSTDAVWHNPNEYKIYKGEAPDYLPPFPDDITGKSFETLCRKYDYPTEWQLKHHLEASNTYLGFLTPSEDPKVVARYQKLNNEVLGNPPGLYQFIDNRSENFSDAMGRVIGALTEYVCGIEYPVATEVPVSKDARPGEVTADKPCCNDEDSGYGLVVNLRDPAAEQLVINYTKAD